MVKAGKSLRPSIQPPPCLHPFTKDFLMASDFLAKACMMVNSAPISSRPATSKTPLPLFDSATGRPNPIMLQSHRSAVLISGNA